MKQHLLYTAKLFGNRMLFNFVTILMTPIYLPIIGTYSNEESFFGFGSVFFSLLICSVYLGIAADMMWKLGKHDKQSFATEKYYPAKGLVLGLLSEIPFLLVFLFVALFPSSIRLRSLYRILCIGSYMGFVPANRVTVGYGLVLLIIPVLSGIFYLVGYKKKYKESGDRLSHKIMYKKQGK